MTILFAQLIGYTASLLLALSWIGNNDFRFRWLNTAGCLAFILYGIFIHAFPVLLTNTLLLAINLFYLIKIYRAEESFDLIEFTGNEIIVKKFLSSCEAGINTYFPCTKRLKPVIT